jgi:HEAT repeat protein
LAALNDQDPGVIQAATVALKKGSPEQVIPALEPLLQHQDAGVRGQAAQIMDSLGWRPDEREQEIWYRVAKGQFFQAAGFGAEALPALEAALQFSSSSMAASAIEALGHISDPRALRSLLQALKSPDPAICIAAVVALTRLGAAEAVTPIQTLIRNRNAQVRVVTVEALGRLRAVSATEILCAALQDPVWEVRREAAEALGRLGDGNAVPSLTAALGDTDADVREAAVVALGSLRDPKAIGPLVLALKDPTSGVRRIAAATLSRIDTDWSSLPEARAAAEELKPALHDNDPGVRHFVGHLLAAMNAAEPGAAPLASSTGSTSEQRRQLAIACFLRVLTDSDRDLRQAAAEALGRLGGEGAAAGLAKARRDLDPGVRVAAEEALHLLGA